MKCSWLVGILLLLATSSLCWAQRSAQIENRSRWDLTIVQPGRHGNLTELQNAQFQMRIDTTRGTVSLANGEIDTSGWIDLQGIYAGYPTLANLVLVLDSGSVDCWFEEEHAGYAQQVRHPDSSHVLIAQSSPLATAGQWIYQLPFWGGRRYRVFVRAHAATSFKPIYETMRN